MKALTFDGTLRYVRDAPMPRYEQESLLRVLLAGICNTDIEITRGYGGFRGILGHEFVGVVEESPQADLIGQRVVGEINVGCGECVTCATGDARHCPRRTALGIVGRDGAMAEFLSLPAANLHVVPPSLRDEEAVFTEPLAAAAHILEQTSINRADRVSVIGDGKLGLLVAQVMRSTGCQLLLIGKHANKLAIAEQRGIQTMLVTEAATLEAASQDCVIEATGSATGFELALRLVRPRGRMIVKSTFVGGLHLDMSRLVVNEVTLMGSRCGRFPRALELLAARQVDVTSLISEIVPLEHGIRAFELAQMPGVLKVLLRPTEG